MFNSSGVIFLGVLSEGVLGVQNIVKKLLKVEKIAKKPNLKSGNDAFQGNVLHV